MPVTTTLNTLADRLEARILGAIASPELAQRLGDDLSQNIIQEYFSSGLKAESGRTIDALTYISEPRPSANGVEIGVVGPLSQTGTRSDVAPKGTIRDFIDWYNKQPDLPKFFIRGGVPSQFAWWSLSRFQKQLLRIKRIGGEFGGESIGPKYMWTHEYGSPATKRVRAYIEKGLTKWRARVPTIIDEWYRSRAGR